MVKYFVNNFVNLNTLYKSTSFTDVINVKVYKVDTLFMSLLFSWKSHEAFVGRKHAAVKFSELKTSTENF